ncbi:DUF2505 family protein [Pseudenhygromyxa sp. WMMC2535]|uniref:DUF2505 family protein n=1 Tax=Pseudenhygromyxa sp. WMMC2535 TaxID=2712867 RepID=UPI00155257DB|nr:DUF2505 family protein [Pseudenhygromyxa sp. WMMC2535]NVB42353.1 DUF2505 family protein [Pseudenhygromyxa sp. WMMC2535]
MTARFETRSTYDAPAQRLFELLADPDFHLRKSRHMGQDKIEARTEQRGDTLVLIVDLWEPAHFGGGETHRTMTFEFDPARLSARWRQTIHGQEKRARAEGYTRVEARGEQRCELITGGEIELKIPVVGKRIEAKIKAGLERNADKEAAFTRAELAKR